MRDAWREMQRDMDEWARTRGCPVHKGAEADRRCLLCAPALAKADEARRAHEEARETVRADVLEEERRAQ